MQLLFLHVLHLDILRRQIESKNKNFLMYGYNAGPPMAIPMYTVRYMGGHDCHGWSSIIAIHKVFTFSFNFNLSSTDIKVDNMQKNRMKMSQEV